MSKIDLDPITSGYNLSKINTNFQKVEDELNNKVLYRDSYVGEPNSMLSNLDMNSQSILNASKISSNVLELGGVQVVPTNLAIDPYNGTREALRRSYAEAGYNLVAGSFEVGGTLVSANDVLLHESTGKCYTGPAGTVAAGTNPASGGFVDRSGELLHSQLSALSGTSLVKHVHGYSVGDEMRMSVAGYSRTTPPSVELIAHRGFRGLSCENTMLAMTTALGRGADSLEMDVQVTSDGHLVLFHDNTLDALTTGTGTVTGSTLSYLRALKFDKLLGTQYYDHVKIPLFSDLLSYAKRTGCHIYPEIKGYRTMADIQLFVDAVADAGLERRCTFQSFDINVINAVRALSINVGAAFLWQGVVSNALIDELYGKNVDLFAEASVLLASPSVISYARSRGVGVAAWTVNDHVTSNQLLNIGVFRQMSDINSVIRSN